MQRTENATQIDPATLTALAARFPGESPEQIRDRARRVHEMCSELEQALAEFWAGRAGAAG
jgi:hypothetical protein